MAYTTLMHRTQRCPTSSGNDFSDHYHPIIVSTGITVPVAILHRWQNINQKIRPVNIC